ncbi:hypothetical protein PO909_014128 [Leuciscus waleckii]
MVLEQPRESRGQREQNLPVTVTSGGNVQGEGSDYASPDCLLFRLVTSTSSPPTPFSAFCIPVGLPIPHPDKPELIRTFPWIKVFLYGLQPLRCLNSSRHRDTGVGSPNTFSLVKLSRSFRIFTLQFSSLCLQKLFALQQDHVVDVHLREKG